VHVYVIDTGVRKTHQVFGGRADWIGDFVAGAPGSPDAADCDPPPSPGHGTHVASIIATLAPSARVHALRILPCSGTTRTDYDAAVRAVDWITAHGSKPAVVNLSAARWNVPDTRLDAAIERSIGAGFVYVLSAGGMDAIGSYTPQRAAGVINVGSTNDADEAVNSKYGPLLTVFARGVHIRGAGKGSDTATFAGDGDSYAAPQISAAVALFLERHPLATFAEVTAGLLGASAAGAVKNAGDAPNRLMRVDWPR
jgi:subtilisin family serine protease